MNLTSVVRTECIGVGLEISGKEESLREIARLAKMSPAMDVLTEDQIFEGLQAREELGSTGFGDGIAIPHCRLPGVDEFVVGMMTIPNGCDFDSLDEQDVQLIVFIVAPESESKEHVRVLSGISQVLSIPGVIAEMVKEPTAEAVFESFLRHVKDEVDTHEHDSKNLMTLFIQDEDIFTDLLKVFAGAEACSFMVVESQNASAHLAKIPLFAGFWSDRNVGFSRIVVATVEKQLTNEMIRRLERVAGNLDDRDDVMLLVQNVVYASGSLEG